jgi:hypothetical protein
VRCRPQLHSWRRTKTGGHDLQIRQAQWLRQIAQEKDRGAPIGVKDAQKLVVARFFKFTTSANWGRILV